MQEGDPAFLRPAPDASHQPQTGPLETAAGFLQRIHEEAEVMDPLAPVFDEAGDGGVGPNGLQQFDPARPFAERLRAAGAGIPAFYTPTGVGTPVAEGKEVREFDGRRYLLERGLRGDFAFVKAWKGDSLGNLIYRKTARNFNPLMAAAATVTITEVEELVEPGGLDPDAVATPGIYVDAIFQGRDYEKRIEQRTNRPKGGAGA